MIKLTEYEYRTLNRISNSDLSELSKWLFPTNTGPKISQNALTFGSWFHKFMESPNQIIKQPDFLTLPDEWRDMLYNMFVSVSQHEDLLMHMYNGIPEVVRTWKHLGTHVPLKCKIDLALTDHLIDWKTTSAKTLKQFEQSILDYNYDRQAAFYLDHNPNLQYFEFVGIQKVEPYSVFRVAYHVSDPVISRGRIKMGILLRTAKQELDKPNGWRPFSWSIKREDFH